MDIRMTRKLKCFVFAQFSFFGRFCSLIRILLQLGFLQVPSFRFNQDDYKMICRKIGICNVTGNTRNGFIVFIYRKKFTLSKRDR